MGSFRANAPWVAAPHSGRRFRQLQDVNYGPSLAHRGPRTDNGAMAAPSNADEFLDLVRKSKLVDAAALDAWLRNLRPAGSNPYTPRMLADMLVCDGWLTVFQADAIRCGKWRGFSIGPYTVVERIGSGRMGCVYLCEDS